MLAGMSHATISQLRGTLAACQRGTALPSQTAALSTGLSPLDRLLPGGGLNAGSLVEWLAAPGGGALQLAFPGVRAALSTGGVWCVVAEDDAFCPLPAAEIAGTRCLLVRPQTAAEAWWAVEQALRCPGVAVTWCWAASTPERVLRRWKLAAEDGGRCGMVFRPLAARRQPSWADVRWLVTPLTAPHRCSGRRLRVELLACRGGFGGTAVNLEFEHATGAVHVVSELADSTSAAGAAGAARAARGAVC